MPGHPEGTGRGGVPSRTRRSGDARAPLPADHVEEPDWSRLIVSLAAQSLLPSEMPLAWLLGPDSSSAFSEALTPLPPPFALGPDGSTWVIPRSPGVLESVGVGGSTTSASVLRASTRSGLVTLWQECGSRCLLDVLAARSLALDGPPIAVGFTLADLVVELAARRWSDLEEVYLVGFGQGMPGLERVRFLPSIGDAVGLLCLDGLDEHRSRCFVIAPGMSGAAARRELSGLLRLVEQVPSTGAICCDTSVNARCTWHLSSHRHTLRLEIRRRSRLSAILSPERWVELTGAPGGRPRRMTMPPADDHLPGPGRGRAAGEPAPAPARRPFDSDAAADGVEIAFLGPVQIIGARENLESHRRLTELIVYLAFHSEGVTGEAVATALWPERRVPRQTIANRLYEARRALGPTSDGSPRIRRVEGRHVLSADVRSDWALFTALTGPGSGPARWRQALALVRGQPFDGLSHGDWVGLEGASARIQAEIVEIAARLGEHLLSAEDPTGATWAARKGIAAAPWDERLYRLLMRAADASGSRGAVESALRWLAQSLDWDGDPLAAVHRETAALYRKLTGPPEVLARPPTPNTGVVRPQHGQGR